MIGVSSMLRRSVEVHLLGKNEKGWVGKMRKSSSHSHDNITLVETTEFFKLGPLDVNVQLIVI